MLAWFFLADAFLLYCMGACYAALFFLFLAGGSLVLFENPESE